MIDVDPMPDELAVAHAGRIAYANGCTSRGDFDLLLNREVARRGRDPKALCRLGQLALVSEMPSTTYARQHSMLAAFRVAAKSGETHLHGDSVSTSFSRRLGLLTQRFGAYVCVRCIKEDLNRSHFSWFRRIHHLIGVDWCQTHCCALSRVTAGDPFARVPQFWLDRGELEPVRVTNEQLNEPDFLARYVQIATALLQRSQPFDAPSINSLLAERGRYWGLRISFKGVRPLLSDRVRALAPVPWLQSHLPELHQKGSGQYFSTIDGLLVSRSVPHVGHTYAIAMAALYDSSEEAIRACHHDAVTRVTAQPSEVPFSRAQSFWHGEVWEVYRECAGSIKLMADRLQMDRTYLGQRMKSLGLPSLHDVRNTPKWRALVRFERGERLERASALEGADMQVVEGLLRTTAAPVVAFVTKLLGESMHFGTAVDGLPCQSQLLRAEEDLEQSTYSAWHVPDLQVPVTTVSDYTKTPGSTVALLADTSERATRVKGSLPSELRRDLRV